MRGPGKKLLILLFLPLAVLFALQVEGVVFLDANRNGIMDKGEKGLGNVLVSDGRETAITDSKGRFLLSTSSDEPLIFVSFPSGYFTDRFYKRASRENPRVDFPLYRIEPRKNFLIIHVTDIHVIEKDNCRRDVDTFVKEANEIKPSFVVATGDLVMDTLGVKSEERVEELYQLFLDLVVNPLKALGIPFFPLPGNHEHPLSLPPDHPLYNKGAYQRFLGPTHYSFNYNGWHFVLLDATLPGEKPGQYKEAISDEEIEWLKKDLDFHKGMPTLVFSHALPMSPDYLKFFQLLSNYKVKGIFFGHLHQNLVLNFLGLPTICTGGLCGSWWGDENPNPDGNPRGYRLILIEDESLHHIYKWVGERHSIDVLSIGNDTVLKGNTTLTLNVYDPQDLIAGVAVSMDNKPPLVSTTPWRRTPLGKTFLINLDVTSFPNGPHTLTLYAVEKRTPGQDKRLWKLEFKVKVEN